VTEGFGGPGYWVFEIEQVCGIITRFPGSRRSIIRCTTPPPEDPKAIQVFNLTRFFRTEPAW